MPFFTGGAGCTTATAGILLPGTVAAKVEKAVVGKLDGGAAGTAEANCVALADLANLESAAARREAAMDGNISKGVAIVEEQVGGSSSRLTPGEGGPAQQQASYQAARQHSHLTVHNSQCRLGLNFHFTF